VAEEIQHAAALLVRPNPAPIARVRNARQALFDLDMRLIELELQLQGDHGAQDADRRLDRAITRVAAEECRPPRQRRSWP
jgi:hypothetical protein